jgi:hypothetical protein
VSVYWSINIWPLPPLHHYIVILLFFLCYHRGMSVCNSLESHCLRQSENLLRTLWMLRRPFTSCL